jgi:hypothetical protein
VLLDNFPDGEGYEEVIELLPLARFLFDMDDGDGLTGSEELDKAYLTAAKAIRQRKYDRALATLNKALELGEEVDRPYTEGAIAGIENLNSN